MRKTLLVILVAAVLIIGMAACKTGVKSDKPQIVVSIYPYELLLRQLVGEGIEVTSIIPANSSPHTWSPTPSAIKSIESADLAITNGLGLETNLTKQFAALGDRHISIADLVKLPQPHDTEGKGGVEHEHGDEDHDHHHEGENPHLWLSPNLMVRAVVELGDILQGRFPEHAQTISANASAMIKDFTALHMQIMQQRDAFQNPAIITYHDSYHHFLHDFNIQALGTVQSSPGKEPTPKELAELGNIIRANGIKAIYVEPQMDRRSATVLAKEFNLKVIELDPIGKTYKPRTLQDVIINSWERMKMGWM